MGTRTRPRSKARNQHDVARGHRLRDERRALGFTLSELSYMSGVPDRTIRHWEHGITPRPGPSLRAYAEVLRRNVRWVLYGNEEDNERAND